MMKRKRILIIVLFAVGVQSQLIVGQKTPTECSSIIDRSLKKDTEKLSLYEVNNDYFLQAEFQKKL